MEGAFYTGSVLSRVTSQTVIEWRLNKYAENCPEQGAAKLFISVLTLSSHHSPVLLLSTKTVWHGALRVIPPILLSNTYTDKEGQGSSLRLKSVLKFKFFKSPSQNKLDSDLPILGQNFQLFSLDPTLRSTPFMLDWRPNGFNKFSVTKFSCKYDAVILLFSKEENHVIQITDISSCFIFFCPSELSTEFSSVE